MRVLTTFTPAQRIALAARDGGCRWGDCDKPPAMTDAHHVEHWLHDHGSTDLRLGILLCNPHHRLLHNQGWQILERQGRHWLRPPASVDPGQQLVEMRSKSPAALEQHPVQHDRDQRIGGPT
ncbi:HNH endonuclease [Cryobacterium adonitolivorans]|uniref:HNH endonuclease n=2 Tax=Cryobacterium adonitolivorans TaxID=1259189 RepID=A0A4R8W5Q0_9MICO|nr:HNH endonuclease [Cryobacterium adonitolivorans]